MNNNELRQQAIQHLATMPSTAELLAQPDAVQRVEQLRLRLIELELQAEEQFTSATQSLFEATPIAQCVATYPDNTIIAVNPRLCELTGFRREELLGRSTQIFSADETNFQALYHRLQRTGQVANWANTLHKPDGTIVYTLVSIHLEAQVKQTLQVIALVDISDQRQLEEMIIESQGKLRAIFDHTQTSILLADSQGNFLNGNRAALNLFGYSHQELTQLKFTDLLSDTREVEHYWQKFSQQGWLEEEIKLRRQDGTEVWVEYRAVANILPDLHLALINDITARRAAIEALRESETRFRMMADSASALIWLANLRHELTYCNLAWLTFTGANIEQVLGHGWLEFVHPDDRTHVEDIFRAALPNHQPYKAEYRLRHHSGEYRWVLDQGVLHQAGDGSIIGYIGSAMDVTPLKAAQAVLERSHAELEQLVKARTAELETSHHQVQQQQTQLAMLTDYAHDILCRWTPTGIVDYISGAVERMLGYAPALFHNQPFSQWLYPDDQRWFERFLHADTIQLYEATQWRVRLRHQNNTYIWFEVATRAVLNTDGGVQYWVGVLRDVTHQVQTEEYHRETEQFLQSILDGQPAITVILDENGTIIAVNERWRKTGEQFGASALLLRGIGQNYVAVCESARGEGETEARAVVQGLRAILSGTRESFSLPYPFINGSTWRWYQLTASRFSNRGKIGVILTHHEITEIKELEAQVSQAYQIVEEEMEQVKQLLRFMTQHQWKLEGKAFLNAIVEYLGKALQVEYVLIDEITEEQPNIAQTAVFWADGALKPNIQYSLVGTPCYNVSTQGFCAYPDNIQQTFPQDYTLVTMQARGYAGVPLRNAQGSTIGIIAILSRSPLTRLRLMEMLLSSIAIRAAHELEQWRSAATLRATEDSYRLLAENITDMISRHTIAGVYTYVTPSVQTLLGYVPHELVGKSAYDLFHPDDLAAIQRSHQGTLEQPATQTVEYRIRHQNGQYIWMETTSRVVHDPLTDEPTEIVAVSRNITQRKQAEAALFASQQAMERLIQQLPIGIQVFDAQGWCTEVNQAHTEIFGVTRADLIKKYNIFNDKLAIEMGTAQAMREALQGQVIELGDLVFQFNQADPRYADPQQKQRILNVTLFPVFDQQGQVINAVGMNVDITARKQIEQALLRAQEQMRLAIQAANLGLWDWDLNTDEVYYSPEWKHQLGYADDEIESTLLNWTKLVHPDDLELANQRVQAYLKNPYENFSSEFRLRHKNGSYRAILSQASLLRDEQGKPQRMLGAHIDITERKKTEEALRESEERFKLAARIAQLGIWDWDVATDRADWFGEMFHIYGITPEEFTGKGADYIHFTREDYRLQQETNIKTAFENGISEAELLAGKPVPIDPKELCIVSPDGTERFTLGDAIAIVDKAGKPVRMLGITIDITERKRTEAALRLSEERYRSAIEASLDAFYLLECVRNHVGEIIDFRFVEVNHNGVHELGLSREALLGASICELFPINRTNGFFEQYKQVATTGIPLSQEYTIPMPHAAPGWYYHQVVKVGDGVAIVNRDITERKRAEAALIQSEARLRSLIEMETTFVLRTDLQGQITYVNKTWLKRFGWLQSQVIGTSRLNSILPEDHEKVLAAMATCVAQPDTPIQVLLRKPSQESEPIWTLWEFVAVQDAQGIPQEIQCVGLDVSELIHAREQIQLHHTALEVAANGVVITDRHGNIEWVNAAFTKLTGYSLIEAVGKNLNVLVKSGQHPPAFYQQLWKTIMAGKVWFGKVINRRKDGTLYTEEQTITPVFTAEGKLTHFIAIKQDVTERERSAQIQREQEHLQISLRKEKELNVWTQQLVASLSHDIRTPLTIIKNSQEILSRYFDRLDEDKRREKLAMIDKQLHFVVEMLNDLSTAVQTSFDQRVFQPTSVNIAALCQLSVDEVHAVSSHPPKMVFINHSNLTTITADETLLTRILLNLLSNAVKFSRPDSEVTLTLYQKNDTLEIHISDQGIGIAPDEQTRIFEPLYRATNVGDIRGTGLGLSIVKSCVERHHGQIRVESQLGHGTTFIVELPLQVGASL